MPNSTNRWSTYESNVQSYRSNFLSSQSALLAVGALMINVKPVFLLIVAVLSITQIWCIWFCILIKKIRVVDYYRYRIGETFTLNGEYIGSSEINEALIDEDSYVNKRKVRIRINKSMTKSKYYHRNRKFKTLRYTRLRLDVIMPCFFTSIWIMIMIASYIK